MYVKHTELAARLVLGVVALAVTFIQTASVLSFSV